MSSFLSTSRLDIRPTQEDDFAHLEKWCSDPDVMLYSGGTWTSEQHQSYAQGIRNHWARYGFGYYLIVEKATSQPIGFISLKYSNDENAAKKIPSLGYALQPASWNQGFVTEAVKALLEYAHREYGFSKICATSDFANKAGNHVLEKLGFVLVGTEEVHLYGRNIGVSAKWEKEIG